MEKNLKILLVEDNPGDAFLVKFYLEESIFKTAEFIHAEYLNTALDVLSKNKIDVVLLDLNLPDSKGVETVQQILENGGESVVIVLTGLSDNELGVQTVKLGAQDFLVKGQFDGKVLTSSIRYAFERAQLKQRVRELDENSMQFHETQEIAELGYWKLDLQSKELWMTSYLKELLGLKVQRNYALKNLQNLLDKASAEKLGTSIEEAIEKKKDFSLSIKLKDQEKPAFLIKARYKTDNDALVGVIQKV
ncbi:MAG: response regulator [Chitinophagales bacterium]